MTLCLTAAACMEEPSKQQEARIKATRVDEPPPGLEYVPPEPGTYGLPAIQDAADGIVVDADGQRRRLFDYMGDKYVLLSFVYTNCRDSKGCPLATAILGMVDRQLEREPQVASQVRLVTLSFDPERDTPEVMREYASHAASDYASTDWGTRPWVFLTTGSEAEIGPILEGYGQYIVPEFDESGNLTGDFSHVLKVYLIDRGRRVRNIYSTEFIHPAIAINDLKTLLLEDAGSS